MNTSGKQTGRMSNFRWVICATLFFATTINYLDRQVLSLTWTEFLVPEFHWTNDDYGTITATFTLIYAIGMLFAGRFIDWLGTKKGFMWAIGVWSAGACIHAFCGIVTSGITAGSWLVGFEGAKEALSTVGSTAMMVNVSVVVFIFARFVLAIGEAGNFPAAIKTTAEFFPKKDRAFSTSIFNAGATAGALIAPISVPFIAQACGWEMTFIIIGVLGFVWMGAWMFIYKKPEVHPKVNAAELEYIQQDKYTDREEVQTGEKVPFLKYFKYRQTWAFAVGKFMTDGVWWFFLFWAPAYLSSVYKMTSTQVSFPLFVLYMITMLAIIGGWLPSYFITKKGMNPYAGRMKSMLIFAFFPLLALLAQPLGHISYWIPVIIIGIAGAAHQAWSANIFSTVGDMFPKKAIATVTGIGGMAGGISAFIINKGSGMLFDYTQKAWSTVDGIPFLEKFPVYVTKKLPDKFLESLADSGHTVVYGINTGYMIVFSGCAVAYLIGWVIMKVLVPKYKLIDDL